VCGDGADVDADEGGDVAEGGGDDGVDGASTTA